MRIRWACSTVRFDGVSSKISLFRWNQVLWRIVDTKPNEMRWHEERYVGTRFPCEHRAQIATIKVNTDIRITQQQCQWCVCALQTKRQEEEEKKERNKQRNRRRRRHSMMIREMRLCVNYSLSTNHFFSFLFSSFHFLLCLLLLHFSDTESSSLFCRSPSMIGVVQKLLLSVSFSVCCSSLLFPQQISTLIIIKFNARIRFFAE